MFDDERRTVSVRTKLTPTQGNWYDGIHNRARMGDDLLVYEAVLIGLTEIEKRLDGVSKDPRARLWKAAMTRAARKQEMAALAAQLEVAESDEERAQAEALCTELGYDVDKVRTSGKQAQTKAEEIVDAKARDKCRAYLRGLLSLRPEGLAPSTILTCAMEAGYSESQVRRSLPEVARKGTGFWYLPQAGEPTVPD